MAQTDLSLGDAIQKGLKNNFQILISSSSTDIAENNNTWGNAGLYPSLNLSLSNNNRKQEIDNPASFLNGDVRFLTYAGQVDMNYTLFNGFRVWINKERLNQLQSQSEGRETIVIQNTVQAIILAYYDALADQERMETFRKTATLSEDRLKYMRNKNELGTASSFDVLQFEVAWQNDRQNLLMQELNFRNAVRQLSVLMGEDGETRYRLTEKLETQPKSFEISQLKSKLETSNEALKNEYINQEILKKQFELERTGRYPRINLNMGGSESRSNITFQNRDATGTTTEYYANVSLSYNIFNGNAVNRNVQNAKINQEIGKLSLKEMKNSLNNRLVTELDLYNIRKEILQLAENSHKTANLQLRLAEERFKSGTINSFDFRDIQLNSLRADINRLDATYNLISSETELLRLTGGILNR